MYLYRPKLEAFARRALEERDHARSELYEGAQIRAALARLDAGTWGVCRTCHRPIAEGRLRLLPEAEECVACIEIVALSPVMSSR